MPTLTVFTPVYNRAYIISELYRSLCAQTSFDFEWLVVDDGSTDQIAHLIAEFQAENPPFPIRFISQPNGGKHRAINRGVTEATSPLFFIVDSDDRLTPDAVEWITANSADIMANDEFAGLSGLRISPAGTKIGGGEDFGIIDTDAILIRSKYHVTGDLAEIYKTRVLKNFPFPDIEGEKFCSEGLVWNRIAMTGLKLRYIYHGIYICEYLGDGLTAGRVKCRINSPGYSMLLYSEALRNPAVGWKNKLKYGILYWRYSELSKLSLCRKAAQISPLYWPLLPAGVIIRKLNR